jgi:hypothetical protein
VDPARITSRRRLRGRDSDLKPKKQLGPRSDGKRRYRSQRERGSSRLPATSESDHLATWRRLHWPPRYWLSGQVLEISCLRIDEVTSRRPRDRSVLEPPFQAVRNGGGWRAWGGASSLIHRLEDDDHEPSTSSPPRARMDLRTRLHGFRRRADELGGEQSRSSAPALRRHRLEQELGALRGGPGTTPWATSAGSEFAGPASRRAPSPRASSISSRAGTLIKHPDNTANLSGVGSTYDAVYAIAFAIAASEEAERTP